MAHAMKGASWQVEKRYSDLTLVMQFWDERIIIYNRKYVATISQPSTNLMKLL